MVRKGLRESSQGKKKHKKRRAVGAEQILNAVLEYGREGMLTMDVILDT